MRKPTEIPEKNIEERMEDIRTQTKLSFINGIGPPPKKRKSPPKRIRRTWMKYINRQLYSECALITALNAYYFLTGKQYCEMGDKTYEELVDLVMAREGAAIAPKKAWDVLEIKSIDKLDYRLELENLIRQVYR